MASIIFHNIVALWNCLSNFDLRFSVLAYLLENRNGRPLFLECLGSLTLIIIVINIITKTTLSDSPPVADIVCYSIQEV